MRAYGVLAIAAGLLLVFGSFAVSQSFPGKRFDADLLLDTGPYYWVITVSGFPDLTLTIQYYLKSPGTLDVYVLTRDEYAVYSYFMYPSGNLYAELNQAAGSFAYTFTALATYYITFANHIRVAGDQQVIHLSVVASGINVLSIAGAIGMLVSAVALLVVARRWRNDLRRAAGARFRRSGSIPFGPHGSP